MNIFLKWSIKMTNTEYLSVILAFIITLWALRKGREW
jgi:hypothetical protein